MCYCRVKTALARKEEVVNSLRRQHEVGSSGGPGMGDLGLGRVT
jgi:hypothetical protein